VSESLPPAPLLNTLRRDCCRKYGEPVGKVLLDPGIPCPHRARGGCVFCRPDSFRPAHPRPGDSPERQLAQGKILLARRNIHRYFAYFQQETPSALAPGVLLRHAAPAAADPACVGLIVAARPDCVADALLDALAASPWGDDKDLAVELGVQTVHGASLAWLERGHGPEDFIRAAARLRRLPGCRPGAHLILGIPGETAADMAESIRQVCAQGATYLKLHHLQVIAGTRLARLHESSPLPLPTAEAYLELLAALLPLVPRAVVLHRLWATSRPELLVAPRWGQRPAALRSRLEELMRRRGIRQGCATPS